MFELFEEEIEGHRFSDRKVYGQWVKGWAEDMIDEVGRVERWALQLDDDALDEMEVKIRKVEK